MDTAKVAPNSPVSSTGEFVFHGCDLVATQYCLTQGSERSHSGEMAESYSALAAVL
jgi:hypothetical protein